MLSVALVLTFLDGFGYLHALRRVLGTRASQNVESREQSGKPGVLVIAAGYGTAARGAGRWRWPRGLLRDPYLALVLSMLVLLVCCALRVAGIDSTPVTVVQFVPTVLLILLTPGAGGRRALGRRPRPGRARRPPPPRCAWPASCPAAWSTSPCGWC